MKIKKFLFVTIFFFSENKQINLHKHKHIYFYLRTQSGFYYLNFEKVNLKVVFQKCHLVFICRLYSIFKKIKKKKILHLTFNFKTHVILINIFFK